MVKRMKGEAALLIIKYLGDNGPATYSELERELVSRQDNNVVKFI